MAQDGQSVGEPGRADKPSKKPNPLKNVYFREQHIHTRNSPDAFAILVSVRRALEFTHCTDSIAGLWSVP